MQEHIDELRSILSGLDDYAATRGDCVQLVLLRSRLKSVVDELSRHSDDGRAKADKAAAADIAENCMCGDREGDHSAADGILCDLLEKLGYGLTVAAWEKVEKWYA